MVRKHRHDRRCDRAVRGHLEGIRSGIAAARSLPMKALLAVLASIIAIKSDGDAGAVLLREH
jgi:hypothetical protein